MYREKKSILFYIIAIVLSILALFAYEMAVVIPLLLLAVDVFIAKPKGNKKLFLTYVPFCLAVCLYFVIRSLSHAFAGGGDYSYNLYYLPFNFVGNYIGYIMLFLGGNNALVFYTMFRDSFREQPILVAGILVLIAVILGILMYTWKKKLIRLVKNQSFVLICFGFVFAAISLLPFLGLGNIAPRYFYLASFGFALTFVALLRYIGTILPHTINKYTSMFLILILYLLSFWYYKENIFMAGEWGRAGVITKDALKVFRVDYESFSTNTQVYFVEAPLKYHDVWLFPVGLNDALWVIYRERLPQVHHVVTTEEARKQIRLNKPKENYIFRFDKDVKVVREM
jgi:hypothetical protein